jgi:hypothetical protein
MAGASTSQRIFNGDDLPLERGTATHRAIKA